MKPSTYTTVGTEGTAKLVVKKSTFLSFAFPAMTVDEVEERVKECRKKYYDARHVCYAYVLEADSSLFRGSDNGELSGTAGRPILGTIRAAGLTFTGVIVVRYFGGIKLGIPGLIRSYRTAAAEALDNAGTVVKTATVPYRVDFGYMAMNSVMKVFKDMDLPQRGQDFGERCSLQTSVRLSEEASFTDRMSHIEDCAATRL